MKNINLLNYLNPKNICRIIKIKLSDVFEIVAGKSITEKSCENGNYNLIGSSKNNNGIIRHINKYDFNENLYTINKNGSVGYLFKQIEKFARTCDVLVLKSKNKYYTDINNFIITLLVSNTFNYSCKFNNEEFKLMNVYIYL